MHPIMAMLSASSSSFAETVVAVMKEAGGFYDLRSCMSVQFDASWSTPDAKGSSRTISGAILR
jgi:hypothetical protein